MATRFDRWASTYEDSALQPVLFVPVHQTVLHLTQRFLPRPRRVLDVGCGTGRLCHRRAVTVPPLRRRRRPNVPAELDSVLAAHQLAVVGFDHTRWLRLPDVQVIAAQHQPAAAPALG